MAAYTQILDLVRAIEPPPDGKVSRTILQDQHLKAVLFGFSEGQELSEHAASTPAVMHFLKGDASVTLGSDSVDASAGT